MEFPLRRADGVFRLFLTRVVPVRDSAETIGACVNHGATMFYRAEEVAQISSALRALLSNRSHLAMPRRYVGFLARLGC